MKAIAVFAFNGDPVCFMHALMNTHDMHEKGHDVKLIIEGSATKLIPKLKDESTPFADLYKYIEKNGLLDCACRACSMKMGTLENAESMGIALCDEMMGHPSIEKYISQGYDIITL